DPLPVDNANVTTGRNYIVVSWETRKAFNYTVCLKNSSESCKEEVSNSPANFTDLLPGKLYNVSIVVHSYNKNSTVYETTKVLPPLPPTNGIVTDIKTNSSVIEWYLNNTLSSGNKWIINIKPASGTERNETRTVKNITLDGLEDGENYTVRVWTLSQDVSSESFWTTSFSTNPLPVDNANVTTGRNYIVVSWEKRKAFNYTVCLKNSSEICKEEVSNSPANFTDLLPGTLYNVSIVVHFSNKKSTVYETTKVLPPLPPTNGIVTDIKTNSSVIEWYLNNTLSSGNKWIINIKPASGTERNETRTVKNITLDGLEDGENYTVRVWTLSQDVSSESFWTTSFSTNPLPVDNANVTTGRNYIVVSWEKRKAFNYTVCLKNSSEICKEEVSNSPANFTDLLPGTLYNVSIVVHFSNKKSTVYETTKVLPPLPPTNGIVTDIKTNSSVIEWYLNNTLSSGNKWIINIKPASGTERNETRTVKNITLDGLEDGENYTVRVWTLSHDVSSESFWTTSFSTNPLPVDNANVTTGRNYIVVSWEKRKAFNYTVCLKNSSESCKEEVSNSPANFTDLLPGTLYNVSIVVHSSNKKSTVYETTKVLPPLPPTNGIVTDIKTNSSVIEWYLNNTLSSGNKWIINIKPASGTERNETRTVKNITLDGLEDGENYTVRVWTLSHDVSSESFWTTSFSTNPLPVDNANVTTGRNYIVVSWEKRKAFNYTVCLKNSLESCKEEVSNSPANFTDLLPGTLYNVSIVVHSSNKKSTVYETTKVLPPLPPTNGIVTDIKTNSSVIEWYLNNTLSSGNKWIINIKPANGTERNETRTVKNITLDGLEDGENYTVRVWTLSHDVSSESFWTTSFSTC
ncbi:hypothetical protein Ahia01_000004100, partial [Argonauta hians]